METRYMITLSGKRFHKYRVLDDTLGMGHSAIRSHCGIQICSVWPHTITEKDNRYHSLLPCNKCFREDKE